MRIQIGLGLLSVVLLAGIYLLFHWYYQPFSAWNLMPPNPILVVESTQWPESYRQLATSRTGQNLRSVGYLPQASARMQYLQKLLQAEGASDDFLKNKRISASLYLTSKEDFDFLFFVPFQSDRDKYFFNRLISQYKIDPDFQFQERLFRNFTIHEVKHPSSGLSFSFILHKDFFVGSYTAILVEDVVRKIKEGNQAFAFSDRSTLASLSPISLRQDGSLVLYLNNRSIHRLVNIFAKEQFGPYLGALESLADHTFLSLRDLQNPLQWEGNSFTNVSDSATFLNIFQGQEAPAFALRDYIPNRTALLLYLAHSDPARFTQAYLAYWKRHDSQFSTRQARLRKDYQLM
ncbi:MAG: hypothetical protein HC880_09675 [Bacteroidia bacterium]|nr:hypothetical protein [Bacteroidia bacterium]